MAKSTPNIKALELVISDLPKMTGGERTLLAEALAEFIRVRTQEKGLDKDNKPFKKYSKEYKKSLDFAIAGKSNKPNLTLSGDMMASFDIKRKSPGEIVLGFPDGDPDIEGRAEGNILGSYGKTEGTGPKRDFLGIKQSDLDLLVAQHSKDKDKKKPTAGGILAGVFAFLDKKK